MNLGNGKSNSRNMARSVSLICHRHAYDVAVSTLDRLSSIMSSVVKTSNIESENSSIKNRYVYTGIYS